MDPSKPWSAGNTPVRMVGALMALGVAVGFVATLVFPLGNLPLDVWWPAPAMSLACGAALLLVGTRANSGGALGADGIVVRYLLRGERVLAHDEIAWAYVQKVRTSVGFAEASDEALRLLAYDGTTVQLTLPPRGRARDQALAALSSLESRLPRAYLGYGHEAARAWARRKQDPAAWRRLVEGQGQRKLL